MLIFKHSLQITSYPYIIIEVTYYILLPATKRILSI